MTSNNTLIATNDRLMTSMSTLGFSATWIEVWVERGKNPLDLIGEPEKACEPIPLYHFDVESSARFFACKKYIFKLVEEFELRPLNIAGRYNCKDTTYNFDGPSILVSQLMYKLHTEGMRPANLPHPNVEWTFRPSWYPHVRENQFY